MNVRVGAVEIVDINDLGVSGSPRGDHSACRSMRVTTLGIDSVGVHFQLSVLSGDFQGTA